MLIITTIDKSTSSLYHHHHPTLSPYTSLFQHVIQHKSVPANPIATNLRYFRPTSTIDHLYESINYDEPHYLHSAGLLQQPASEDPSFNTYSLLSPLTSGHLEHVSDLTYIVNGRILKQYLVMENHDEDNTLDSFLNDPVNRNAYVPYLPHLNFNRADRPNLGFPNGGARTAQLNAAQSTQNFGQQIAVGSGSLGFVRHANGAVYLGSGSLGYNNDQQRSAAVQNRNGKSPAPSPLSFGHNPQ